MNKETLENSKQGLPQLGTKEFNDLASAYFGGKPKQERMYSEEEVEKQKLEFAIEQLNEIKSKMSFFEISNMENTLDNLHYKIQELEQKLSEL